LNSLSDMKNRLHHWIAAALSLALWLSLAGVAVARSPLPSPVLSAEQLRPLVERRAVTVLDTRELFQTDGKSPNYAAGHIPGALPAPYSSFRGPADNPGAVMPIAKLNGLIQSLGLHPDQAIVLAGSGSDPTEFGGVARIYWTLKAAGFQNLAVLNGGTGAWMAAKFPLATQAEARAIPSKTSMSQLQYNPNMIVASTQVQAVASRALLVDARPEEFFLGELRHPAASRWGTLPGAKHLDSAEWFVPNTGRLLNRAQLEAIAKREGFEPNRSAIVFCNTGHWAATHWFITSEVLGYSSVRMYPESVVGWSRLGLPMDNEPSRSTVLLRQLKGEGVMG
jgi:thiosulfate/3-mercaptopyruvate sulfurtransferase